MPNCRQKLSKLTKKFGLCNRNLGKVRDGEASLFRFRTTMMIFYRKIQKNKTKGICIEIVLRCSALLLNLGCID